MKKTLLTFQEAKDRYNRTGKYWFSRNAMRGFNTRINEGTWDPVSRTFVTSDAPRGFDWVAVRRRYQVIQFSWNYHDVRTISKHMEFAKREQATMWQFNYGKELAARRMKTGALRPERTLLKRAPLELRILAKAALYDQGRGHQWEVVWDQAWVNPTTGVIFYKEAGRTGKTWMTEYFVFRVGRNKDKLAYETRAHTVTTAMELLAQRDESIDDCKEEDTP